MAVAIPPDLAGRLVTLQDSLKTVGTRVSWVRGENIHVTLRFLGEVEEKRIPKMIRVLQETVAGIPPFSLTVEGLGCFPSSRSPRVIFVGVGKGGAELSDLQGRVEGCLARIGFPREGKRFTGHLTLGRVRSPERSEALLTRIASLPAQDLGQVTVQEILLMRSELSPAGSQYSVIAPLPLQGVGDLDAHSDDG